MVIKKERKYYYSIGRRKTAVASVRLYENGRGEININNKPITDYIHVNYAKENILKPLQVTDNLNNFDLSIKVKGSGIIAQSMAISLGIAKALLLYNSEYKNLLKLYNLLTRDPRRAERKKPGRHGARRGVQFSKR